ncbi:MAG: protein kinase domain-containing protein [Gemmataceae bacterium]
MANVTHLIEAAQKGDRQAAAELLPLAAFLEQACAGRPGLRTAIEALLVAHAQPSNVPNKPPVELGQTVASELGAPNHGGTRMYSAEPEGSPAAFVPTTENRLQFEPGLVIAGRYTLAQKIGEGGMGEVWVAKQTEPIKRKVALKFIKTGMDSRVVLARFEQERQALALMDHPNIARVLDGGMTPNGQPFFVMELVNGLALNKYCDEAKLTLKQRLELFVPICQAVQHAHQKGIVHRDLKPANILITMIDANPVPKVIDFGVAKATAGKLTDESMSTQFGAVVGTLEYMSPEQAAYAGEDIDTRADIYSLGVILYELLTGLKPIDAKRLRKAAFTEMVRIIREEEPSKPSTRLSTDESLPSLAALRQTEPKKLTALLRGELDWVVMKCLEKQRERRYETAIGLARDIQRYLAYEVVEARPPTAGYRLKKFVRRNRVMVSAGSVVAGTLLVGVVAFAWQATIATRQSRIAVENEQRANENYRLARQAVDDYLTRVSENTLLRVQPSRDLRELRKQLLEDALKFYQSFIDQHRDDPTVQRELGRAYVRVANITDTIGSRPDALAGYSKALEIRRALAEADSDDPLLRVEVAETLYAIGALQRSMGRSADALAALQEARRLLEDLVSSNPNSHEPALQLAKVNSYLGATYKGSQQWDLARPVYNRANTLLRGLVEADPEEPKYLRDLAWSTYQIGNLLSDPLRPDADFPGARGYYDDALSLYRRLIAAHPREPDYSIDMAQCYVSLASLADHGDRDIPGAVRFLEQALDLQKKVVATHPTVTLYLLDLAGTYYNLAYRSSRLPGRHASVVGWYRESIAIAERLVELDPENVDFQDRLGRAVSNLGFNICMCGQIDQAVREYLRAIEIHRRVQATGTNEPRHRTPLAVALEGLGWARVVQRKQAEALEAYHKALTIRQQLADVNPANTAFQDALANTHNSIGRAYSREKRFPEAFTAIDAGLAIRQKLAEAGPSKTSYSTELGESHAYRGTARVRAGQPAEAAADLRRALELWAKSPLIEIEPQVERARSLALLAGLTGDAKSGVTAAEAITFADQSVAALTDVVKLGWALPSELQEPDFDMVRGRPDFQKLFVEVEARAEQPAEKMP